MSRFSNLEFENPEQKRSTRQAEREPDDLRQLGEARLAFESAEFERALRAFAKVIEFNPHNASAWSGQVRSLIELAEFHEASLWADKALERFPGDAELLAAKAVALGRLGQLEEALAYSDSAVQARDDIPYVWLARGDVLLAREENRADFCFEKALPATAKDWVTNWLAARIRSYYRQFALALKLVQQALELRADHPVLWLLAGKCQRELGLTTAARASFAQAVQLNPGCHEARHAITALNGSGLGAHVSAWWRRIFGRSP